MSPLLSDRQFQVNQSRITLNRFDVSIQLLRLCVHITGLSRSCGHRILFGTCSAARGSPTLPDVTFAKELPEHVSVLLGTCHRCLRDTAESFPWTSLSLLLPCKSKSEWIKDAIADPAWQRNLRGQGMGECYCATQQHGA